MGWQFSGPNNDLWNVDQLISISRKARFTYWALQFRFTGSGDAGYIGLQTNGNRFNRTTGDTAIFSLWNANATRNGQCGSFGNEGSGQSCRIPWTLRKAWYRLRVWRLERDNDGQWYGAWIYSFKSGFEYHLGDIRVPADGHTTFGDVVNFAEYFGPQRRCDSVPKSTVLLTQPAANSRGPDQGYQYYSSYRPGSFVRLDCTGGAAVPATFSKMPGVRLSLGGHR